MLMTRIVGIGCDIIKVERIKKAVKSPSFLIKIFSENERLYFKSFAHPWPVIAGHFAAKEAVAKALGTGFSQGLTFQDIKIEHNSLGKPLAILSDKSALKWPQLKLELSISHELDYAVAYAIAFES
jgi:holo-[acyl-carrier protein] synthase